jgi:methyltransferase (TIGR00027 family)
MLKNLKRVIYYAEDIEKGRDWYQTILNSEPLYSSPIIVLFKVNDSEITILPSSQIPNIKSALVYWDVEDIDETYNYMLEKGASPLREPRTVVNSKFAEVTDPFGNIIGLTGKVSDKNRSLKDQPSDSAMTVAFCRAVSAAEPREEIKGPDNLAHIFLNEESKRPVKDPAAREWTLKNILKGGAYEYFIARTAYIDNLLKEELNKNIPQVVFLGAGYDTRAIRFRDCVKDTRIFELDSLATQKRKLRLLEENKIAIPEFLKYIPIDFNTDDLRDKLFNYEYQKNRKTFFIWEGVTYYLSSEAFYKTLKMIKEIAVPGSMLFFDYMLYSEERHTRPDIKDALGRMKALYKAESVGFMVNEGEIQKILEENGFTIKEEMMTAEMEQRYLLLNNGSLSGRIIDLFSFVTAEVK